MRANVSGKKIDSIRVDTGVKKIEVNDEGETISLNFADQSFPARYFAMVDEFQAQQDVFRQEAEQLDREREEKKLSEYDHSRKVAAFNLKIHEFFKDRVDGLFGEGTCRKVFGDIVPSLDLYVDFINQLAPYFEKYSKERQKKLMQKYNPKRKGNV
ncbi:MAG TPA: hypothetical protein H9691_05665 [Firmicutes bacterium]|nr:hypothetical protein [Bacillota bacterium]